MVALEVGFQLNNNIKYYQKILKANGAINRINCQTRDIYWTKKSLDGMSENEIKNACVRLRITRVVGGKDKKLFTRIKNKIRIYDKWEYRFQNYKIFDSNKADQFVFDKKKLKNYINNLERNGFKKIFDTYKTDYQYSIGAMKSRIQLQNIKSIGLLLYYDNPNIYNLPLEEQRIKLINELNSYGFNFRYDELELDKLRTLYYNKNMYSKNQNS
jgi:hypothetical protein